MFERIDMKGKSTRRAQALLATLLLAVSLMLAGCLSERIDGTGPEFEAIDYGVDTTTYASMRATTPTHVTESIGGVIDIDAEVEMPEEISPAILNAEPVHIERHADELSKLLFGTTSYKKEGDPYEEVRWSNIPQTETYQMEADDGASLFVNADYIGFQSANFADRYLGTGTEAPMSDSVAPFKQESLAGFSPDEAIEKVRKLIGAMGIEEVASIKAYALPVAAMQAVKDDYVSERLEFFEDEGEDPDGLQAAYNKEVQEFDAIEYGQEDEMYVVHAWFGTNGVPISATSFGTRYSMSAESSELEGCYLCAYVGKEGIREITSGIVLKGGSVYDDDYEAILPLDEAMNALGGKYGSVAGASLAMVDRVALEYCPVIDANSETGIVLVPAWTFRNAQDPDYAIRVNALTGEVI